MESSRVWPITKRYLDKWQFYKIYKSGKNFYKVWQKIEQDDKRGMSIIYKRNRIYSYRGLRYINVNYYKLLQKGASWQMAIITKMANWATFHLRFAIIQMRWQKRYVDNCEFYENDKCCKIREFGKDSSKDWENCLLIISKNSNFG